MKPIRKKTSGEDIAAIKKGYREGVSMSALGRQFKMTRTAIKRRLDRIYKGEPRKVETYKKLPKTGKSYDDYLHDYYERQEKPYKKPFNGFGIVYDKKSIKAARKFNEW